MPGGRNAGGLPARLTAVLLAAAGPMGCEVYAAPTDVVLFADTEDLDEAVTVVQPDILVVCNRDRIRTEAIVGPPDLVVEVSSLDSESGAYQPPRWHRNPEHVGSGVLGLELSLDGVWVE